MTKRLSAGVLLFVIALFAFSMTANAERLEPKEWENKSEDPYRSLPLFFRASAGTTWVQVNSTGGCDPADVTAGDWNKAALLNNRLEMEFSAVVER